MNAVSANMRANASGSPLLRASDTFVIAGCTLPTVGGNPCVQVQWLTRDLRSKAQGDFTLSDTSVGLCLAADQAPQGTVIISMTQQQVKGQ